MKEADRIRRAAAGLILAGLIFGTPAAPATAAVADWHKGSSMASWGPEDFGNPAFRQSLANLRAAHADWVALIIPVYQDGMSANEVKAGPLTPTDTALRAAISYAHSLGMKVSLKPHLRPNSDEWRARITPSNRTAWFRSYERMLQKYAKIAEETGAEEMVLGTELINMTDPAVHPDNTQEWRNIIGQIRQVYGGRLTYSANWGSSGWNDEKNHIQFWNDLDSIGVSAYFYMTTDSSAVTVEELVTKWKTIDERDLRPLAEKWGKDIQFTEIGYRSRSGALQRPPAWDPGGAPNEAEQAMGYEALFRYFQDKDHFAGVYWWDWENQPDAGGFGDTGFTPQHKAAESVMSQWFGGGTAPGQTRALQGKVALSGEAWVGRPTAFLLTLKNLGSPITDGVVDFELVDQKGVKVFQYVSEGQDFGLGEERIYSIDWTPERAGSFKIRTGVFSGAWTENYFWDEPYSITVFAGAGGGEEVVLWTAHATTSDIHGNWSRREDPTAAGGIVLRDVNDATPKIEVASPNPQNYFEISFPAKGGVPYHLWLRMKADSNHYSNDSVHVQFSDSLDEAGNPKYRTGTTSSLAVILEEGNGAGDDSWGWNDAHYGGLGPHVQFAGDGTHTLRIQEREDGVSIDQIVLSPATYLTTRPGAAKRDTTILGPTENSSGPSTPTSPEPAPAPTSTPTSTPPSDSPPAPTSTEPLPPAPAPTPTEPPPSPSLSTLDVWWPTTDSWVGGVQPFKAMLQGWSVWDYEMYWQVDGDRLNPMYVSEAEYPHKEAWVDLGPWNWQSENNYRVKFIAKDARGNVIGEREVVIHILR